MIEYFKHEPWSIVEEGFNPAMNEVAESACSIGNGFMGQRGNFEETYSGKSLQGSYIGGVYYPDKTRVGWWKNGYPEYFAKVLNSTNWIGLSIEVEGEELDLNTWTVQQFRRELDMKRGLLKRIFTATSPKGKRIEVQSTRFYSLKHPDFAALEYVVKPLNFNGTIRVHMYNEGAVRNKDSNYEELFWEPVPDGAHVFAEHSLLSMRTRKLGWVLSTATRNRCSLNNIPLNGTGQCSETRTAHEFSAGVSSGDSLRLEKFSVLCSNFRYPEANTAQMAEALLQERCAVSFETHAQEQEQAWAAIWERSDVLIEGDVPAQQAVRFNIFHLNQTYTGADARLNIGPKGFTGEKYGGSTYWDTEAYCIPFFLLTAPASISRQLLEYRYRQLPKAIENAAKLGFDNGAALFPMVTMNGEECHNEWEITFEEIHRNGAMAWAIHTYMEHTGDRSYLEEGGLEVLIGIARFWAQRVHWSEMKQQYVMHGVTGPNEYENNVNNNWYTNYLAVWCLNFTMRCLGELSASNPAARTEIIRKTSLDIATELPHWKEVASSMFLPEDAKRGIFVQHEGFLDKELMPVSALDPKHLPLNQKWSWDRILRSCFIKQADVLQGLYFFEDHFSTDQLERNFSFYEPMTVHESSLSPCIHSIQASRLGMKGKAYELYLRTARLDLDNYNNDTEDGLHITSMAGSYLSIVQGFAGVRIRQGILHLNPVLPQKWNSCAFSLRVSGNLVKVFFDQGQIRIQNLGTQPVKFCVKQEEPEVLAPARDRWLKVD
ncbi:MAG: glycoside hydrolase family 65 protein [Bacteroidetes bacterium]|nr:glycoside hydrolase family 65 protein [Bacteroidota bacterium]